MAFNIVKFRPVASVLPNEFAVYIIGSGTPVNLRAAVWSKPDQSDIQWIPFVYGNWQSEELFFNYMAHITNINSCQSQAVPTYYNVHVYEDINGTPNFLTKAIGQTSAKIELDLNGGHIPLYAKFGLPDITKNLFTYQSKGTYATLRKIIEGAYNTGQISIGQRQVLQDNLVYFDKEHYLYEFLQIKQDVPNKKWLGKPNCYNNNNLYWVNWNIDLLTLYPYFTPRHYTLSFDSNGGTYTPQTIARPYGTRYGEYGSLPVVDKSGYEFVGWFTALEGGTQITDNSICWNNATAYAHWKVLYPMGCKVIFDPNGGLDTIPPDKIVGYNAPYENLPNCIREGYIFKGWYTAKTDGYGTLITSSSICKSDITLYAHWEYRFSSHYVPVNIYLNGGRILINSSATTEDIYSSVLREKDITLRALRINGTPTKDNYCFKGWFDKAQGGNYLGRAFGDVLYKALLVEKNYNIYAQWIDNASLCTLTFDAQGGTVYPATKYLSRSEKCGVLPLPTKDNYVFMGWYTEVKNGEHITEDTIITENITAYAHWFSKDQNIIEYSKLDVFDSNYVRIAKAPIIKPKIKLELLDDNENVVGEIVNDLSADKAGSISINYQSGVRRSCSVVLNDPIGKYVPSADTGLFWINRKFKLYIGLEDTRYHFEENPLLYRYYDDLLKYGNPEDKIFVLTRPIVGNPVTWWFSQGVYYVSNPESVREYSNKTTTINGVDKFGIFGSELNTNQLEGIYKIPSGTGAYQAIRSIQTMQAGDRRIIDPKPPIFDPILRDMTLPYTIQKSPSEYLSDVLIEIGNMLGADIYYDVNGVLRVTNGTTDLTYSERAPIWDFTDVEKEYLTSSINFNFNDAVNVVKVAGGNVNESAYFATAENNNPLSPTRIDLIGRKILYVENTNIHNQSLAQDFANYTLRNKSIVQLSSNFNCTLLPHLDVDRVITISDKYYKYENQRFIIQSLEVPLNTSDSMSVTACNIASLPYYELQNGGDSE